MARRSNTSGNHLLPSMKLIVTAVRHDFSQNGERWTVGEARTTVDGCCLEVRRRGVACARVDLLDAETIVNGVRNGVGRNENHGYFLDFAPLGAGNRLRTVTSDRTRVR